MADALKEKFIEFASFGHGQTVQTEMESKAFKKIFEDSGLMDKSALNTTAIDLIFTKHKAKAARKMTYVEFCAALADVAAKKNKTVDEIKAAIVNAGAKAKATVADYVKFHDDKSTYTGVYANGGPTNVDHVNRMAHGDLSTQLDRSSADKRGVKHTHQ